MIKHKKNDLHRPGTEPRSHDSQSNATHFEFTGRLALLKAYAVNTLPTMNSCVTFISCDFMSKMLTNVKFHMYNKNIMFKLHSKSASCDKIVYVSVYMFRNPKTVLMLIFKYLIRTFKCITIDLHLYFRNENIFYSNWYNWKWHCNISESS
jgi:hypothetical protein